MQFADVVSGEADAADVAYLAAAICAAVAAVLYVSGRTVGYVHGALVAAAVALIALGLLLL